jgi:hypothetical protein
MNAAVVSEDGTVRQLGPRADAPGVVTAEDVQDPEKLARFLNDMRREQAAQARRWSPRVLIDRDRAVTSGDTVRIEHGFGSRVLYGVGEWRPATPGDVALFDFDEDSDGDALLLTVGNTGTVTLIVVEVG